MKNGCIFRSENGGKYCDKPITGDFYPGMPDFYCEEHRKISNERREEEVKKKRPKKEKS